MMKGSKTYTREEALAAWERLSKALEKDLAEDPEFKAELEQDTTMGYDTLEEKEMDLND